eukprot:2393285-Prymnesium_polylepis.1
MVTYLDDTIGQVVDAWRGWLDWNRTLMRESRAQSWSPNSSPPELRASELFSGEGFAPPPLRQFRFSPALLLRRSDCASLRPRPCGSQSSRPTTVARF